MSGSKQKLSITQWDVKKKAATSAVFSVMLNPSGYSQTIKIKYVQQKIPGKAAPEPKYGGTSPETLELEELIFDGTGVVSPQGGSSSAPSVKKQIEDLKHVVYDPITGDRVERPVVQVIWGSLSFLGRIETIVAKYTLFKPSGEPLRARVKLTFSEYSPDDENAIKNQQSSATNITKQEKVKAGGSLPLMCFVNYQDSKAYKKVAKANGLTSFRGIPVGTTLVFPAKR